MKRIVWTLTLAAIVILASSTAAFAAPPAPGGPGRGLPRVAAPALNGLPTVVTGQTDGGAYYMIIVPPGWNGDLVIWNHGFSYAPPAPVNPADPNAIGPLAQWHLAEGYAVAASSYQQDGWAVFKTKNDLQNLVGAFKYTFGTPRQIWLYGASLGGIVTAGAIEQAHLGNVAGALSLCGAVAGSRNWDGGLDLRLIYDVVCRNTPAAALPGGATGLPAGYSLGDAELRSRINACTGYQLPPLWRTPTQKANFAAIVGLLNLPVELLAIPEVDNVYDPFFQAFKYASVGLQNLVFDPTKLDGHMGTGNAHVDYGNLVINTAIQRVTPDVGAAKRLYNNYTPTGAVGSTKIVSMHTHADPVVIVENESAYAAVVPKTNLTTAVVMDVQDFGQGPVVVPTHCGFTAAEAVAGWESLRAWVAGAAQPTAQSIQLTCGALAGANPLTPGPCRIDPTYVVGNINNRIRPR